MEGLEDSAFMRNLVDTLPSALFIVDVKGRLQGLNEAASRLVSRNSEDILMKRGGEVLSCIHSMDIGGCGSGEACQRCVINNSVRRAVDGKRVHRRWSQMELIRDDKTEILHFLVTTAPFPHSAEHLVLLILEDVTELMQLRSLLPMCANCKKIRNDEDFWESVEGYFSREIAVDFTHGICPDCISELYPEYCDKQEEQSSST